MSRSTFRVLFYLKRNAPKKNGLVPVMCRITVNGKISQFSCKLDVEEKLWNVNLGRMSGRSVVAQEANRMLDKIRVSINKAYQEIMDRDGYVSAEKVRNAFLGMGQNHKTLLAVFRQHNEDYAKQVGKMKSQRSYWKYCTVYNHLEEFIKHRYKVSDIALRELSTAFITDFELFLRTEKNHCTNTVWSYMMPFRSISQPIICRHHSMGIYGLRPTGKRLEQRPISDCLILPNISSKSIKVWQKAKNYCLYHVMPIADME